MGVLTQGMSPKTEGRKDDSTKLRYDLLPARSMRDVAAVMTHGANKYGDENWKMVPELERRYIAAAKRHIEQYRCGEWNDEGVGGSGYPHLAHAICSLLFILEWRHMLSSGEVEVAKEPSPPSIPLLTHEPEDCGRLCMLLRAQHDAIRRLPVWRWIGWRSE